MERGLGLGVAAAALVVCAAGARADETAGAGPATGEGGTCELARVTDRSRVSSFRCIACHDDAAGPGVSFAMGRGPPGHSMSHPVEVDYAQSYLRDGARYVPEARLPDDVPLVGGKVACTSCHDARSTNAKHVVDPARLCYACHQL